MLLYLIRHAETVSNVQRKFQGKLESPLTEKGERQIKLLTDRLKVINKRVQFSKIYSSPLDRALKTAEPIASALKIRLEVSDLLMEMDHGSWDGLTIEQINRNYEELWRVWRYSPHLARFPEGESLLEAQNRFREFVEELIRIESINSNIIVVSHAGLIKLGILFMLQIPLEKYWIFGIENASITVVKLSEFSGRLTGQLVKLNDTGHLDVGFGEPQLRTLTYLDIPK